MFTRQTPVSPHHPLAARFNHQTYHVRKKFWQFFGGSFYVYDPNGALVLFSRMKAFKLKEDIRVFTDETLQTEALSIQARSVLDFSGSYYIYDSASGRCGARG
jgi:threonyl-tRNA synthetase